MAAPINIICPTESSFPKNGGKLQTDENEDDPIQEIVQQLPDALAGGDSPDQAPPTRDDRCKDRWSPQPRPRKIPDAPPEDRKGRVSRGSASPRPKGRANVDAINDTDPNQQPKTAPPTDIPRRNRRPHRSAKRTGDHRRDGELVATRPLASLTRLSPSSTAESRLGTRRLQDGRGDDVGRRNNRPQHESLLPASSPNQPVGCVCDANDRAKTSPTGKSKDRKEIERKFSHGKFHAAEKEAGAGKSKTRFRDQVVLGSPEKANHQPAMTSRMGNGKRARSPRQPEC